MSGCWRDCVHILPFTNFIRDDNQDGRLINFALEGGEIASTFDHPEATKLGHCKLIEEIMIGEDKLIHFSGVQMGEACTIVLRGASACLPCLSAHTVGRMQLIVCLRCMQAVDVGDYL
jgi:hypothetical protein